MALNDLSNKENVALTYMKELLRSQFPDLDTSDHGAFMETFGIPHIKLLTPLLDIADRIKLTQSLDNAELMTVEEMDGLAAGYFAYRGQGEYSTGYVTLSFDDIPTNGVIQIPAGTEVQSKQGYRYQSVETMILDELDLSNYYNPDEFLYQIPVLFQAENPGATYDVDEGDVNTIVTTLNHLISVYNEIKFSGGKDQETNLDLANRIKETAGTANLGVEKGWKAFAKGFNEVEDVIVAGYGHPLMKRDVVGKVLSLQNVPVDVHWGGKVDLHIRGTKLTEVTETQRLQKNSDGDLYIPLTYHPTYDILDIQFSAERFSDPKLDASFFMVKDFFLLKDENSETIGTLDEVSWAIIVDDRLYEQDIVTVRYRYNQLFENINDSLYTEDNRPPVSDVKLKEAKKKMVQGAVVVRLDSAINLQEKDKNIIRQRVYNWINQLPMGVELQTSDFTEPIYQYEDDSIDTKVDYIQLPPHFFVTDFDSRYLFYCMNQEKRDFLEDVQSSSMYFGEWIPYFKDNVTVYDFFDVFHVLTYSNLATDAWKTLSKKDNDWGKRVNNLNIAKTMVTFMNSEQLLSPPRWTAQENVYFGLGNLMIYEDVTYTSTDLEALANLYETIANPGAVEKNVDNILHLVLYCCVILYIITREDISVLTVEDLFEWLKGLTKGTPIDYDVHI